MITRIVGAVWSKTPRMLRLHIIRLTQKKFTVSVAAIIINEAGEVLLLDHVIRPKSNWGIPGGFIDSDEQPEDAIKRELLEETGLKLSEVKHFKTRSLGRHIEVLFTAKPVGAATVQSREIKGLGWFDVDEMPHNMSQAQKTIVRAAIEKIDFV